ncbi:adenosylcobinamide amidohydrolase [Paenibacillus silvisoli]|uniref:adenosylcobinamide amidohydrolase n=1 Tax=Paenibacillus silvisoli TaxID=3110539 RepID=UPI0028051808|nr:adenosylcobinamide amidohydrolase [Paenibacillus silvisoli]
MSQPFRKGNKLYVSTVCPGITVRMADDRMVLKTGEPQLTLSSAAHGGGFGSGYRFINWKVPSTYESDDPGGDLVRKLCEWGYSHHTTLCTLTSAELTNASIAEAEGETFSLLCCTTAGTSNAVRAGLSGKTAPSAEAIHTFLFIDGQLSTSAMVSAVITVTEAKTAALQDRAITDEAFRLPATGTPSDAVVIASSQSERYAYSHTSAGAATALGAAIGKLVYETVTEAVQSQWNRELGAG